MINKDFDYIKRRYGDFWKRHNETPLISAFAPKKNAKPYSGKTLISSEERWMDFEEVFKREIHTFENTYYGGDAFPCLNPNLGPDIYAAMMADCQIEFGESTSWSKHSVQDWDKTEEYLYKKNHWHQKISEMTEYALRNADGRYLVGVTDIHSGLDGLTSLRGPDMLCMDLYDCPASVKAKLSQSEEFYKRLMQDTFALINRYQEGTTNWMQIYHPDKNWYVTSCDFSCLIGRDDFIKFGLDTVKYELELLDASMYHLDGVGALHHLDTLLQLEKLNGIQWVYGAGQPTAKAWKDVLMRIQNAGKNIQVEVTPGDIDEVCGFLKPQGVHLVCWCGDEDQAKKVVERVEKHYFK